MKEINTEREMREVSNSGRIFVTGMGRSGTSLLDKLLCSHPRIDILSQPFPLVFVEAKRRFLRLRGRTPYFVLNDDRISRDYTQEAFDAYLDGLSMDAATVEGLFREMEGYSGQTTKPDRSTMSEITTCHRGFAGVIEYCLEKYSLDERASWIGTKEIMCEEFMPYLLAVGYRCILIVRDPRDVLASANYPRGEKYLGSKKPTLFVLRTWDSCRMRRMLKRYKT